jgi:hypothetical protein
MTAGDIVRTTYDATLAMARVRAKHGLVPDSDVEELEGLVNRTRRLMGEIERAVALRNFDQLQDVLRTLKPEIDEVNRLGPWSNERPGPLGKYARQSAKSRCRGTSRNAKGVWGFLKGWRNR